MQYECNCAGFSKLNRKKSISKVQVTSMRGVHCTVALALLNRFSCSGTVIIISRPYAFFIHSFLFFFLYNCFVLIFYRTIHNDSAIFSWNINLKKRTLTSKTNGDQWLNLKKFLILTAILQYYTSIKNKKTINKMHY